MPIIGDPAATTGTDYLLPRQGASYKRPYSLERHSQLGMLLSPGLSRALGNGVLSGGVVQVVTGLNVKLVSPTVLVVGGLAWSVPADLTVGLGDGTTNTVWAIVARVPADQDNRQDYDTYILTLEATPTDVAPTAADGWFRLAFVPTAAGAVTGGDAGIDNAPPGKYLGEPLLATLRANTLQGRSAPLGLGLSTLAVGGTGVYTARKAEILAPLLVLTGVLTGNRQVELPYTANAIFRAYNLTTGAFSLTVRVATHAGVVVAQSRIADLMMYGGDVQRVTEDVDPTDAVHYSGEVPATRVITAGTGLTGGGDLTANRTLDVVANADGSIVANANDVQVGILATDAQHGNRGGGALHANVVAAGAAGFMTGADKTKLNGLSQAAASSDAAAAQSAAYVQADVQAILDELRDLKSKLRTAGLLAT